MRGRLSAAGTAAGTLLAVVVGCADQPVSPLPTQTPVASAVAPAVPAASGTEPRAPSPRIVATAAGRPEPVTTRRRTSPPATTPTTTPPTTTPPTTTPPSTSATPSLPPGCLGTVRYDLDGAAEKDPPTSLCFTAGSAIHILHAQPGEVTVEPADQVSMVYDPDVVTANFGVPGTFAVTLHTRDEPSVIAVQVGPYP